MGFGASGFVGGVLGQGVGEKDVVGELRLSGLNTRLHGLQPPIFPQLLKALLKICEPKVDSPRPHT